MYGYVRDAILAHLLPKLFPSGLREDERSQAEDDLRAWWGPAHSRATQPLFDQDFACGLGNPRSDRHCVLDIMRVAHLV